MICAYLSKNAPILQNNDQIHAWKHHMICLIFKIKHICTPQPNEFEMHSESASW